MKLSPSFLTVLVPRETQVKKELLEIKDFYSIGTYCSVEFDPKNLSIEVKKTIIYQIKTNCFSFKGYIGLK